MEDFYEEILGEDDEVFDYLLFSDILRSIAEGLDNLTIAGMSDLPEVDIEQIAKKYYNFAGWKLALDFSPILWYNAIVADYTDVENKYVEFIVSAYDMSEEDALLSFNVAERYYTMREKVMNG